MSDREILYVAWTKNSDDPDLQLERSHEYRILVERYPRDEMLICVFLFARIEDGINLDCASIRGETLKEMLGQIQVLRKSVDAKIRAICLHLLAFLEESHLDYDDEEDGENEDKRTFRAFLISEGIEKLPDLETANARLVKFENAFFKSADIKTANGGLLGVPGDPAEKPIPLDQLSFEQLAKKFGTDNAKPYGPTVALAVGDRVSHAKFGLGFVVGVDSGKAALIFSDGRRRLLCGAK
jgi:hypothetical protein